MLLSGLVQKMLRRCLDIFRNALEVPTSNKRLTNEEFLNYTRVRAFRTLWFRNVQTRNTVNTTYNGYVLCNISSKDNSNIIEQYVVWYNILHNFATFKIKFISVIIRLGSLKLDLHNGFIILKLIKRLHYTANFDKGDE